MCQARPSTEDTAVGDTPQTSALLKFPFPPPPAFLLSRSVCAGAGGMVRRAGAGGMVRRAGAVSPSSSVEEAAGKLSPLQGQGCAEGPFPVGAPHGPLTMDRSQVC